MSADKVYSVVQVDVFAARPFGGNPLAVFLDGRGLDDETMQQVALEMNLSEITFVLPPDDPAHAAKVRIFTPRAELQFAGHPTVGTAWVLASRGLLSEGARTATLELGIGPVQVELVGDDPATPDFIWMTQGEPHFGDPVEDRDEVASALSLEPADLDPNYPAQAVSTGNWFLMVPVRDTAAVDRVSPNPMLAERLLNEIEDNAHGFFVFTPIGEGRVYSRMIAVIGGRVWEDPATGSASGPLGAYVVQHGMVSVEVARTGIVSEQGTAMGRQSFVHIAVETQDGEPGAVRVGGAVVPVFESQLKLLSH